MVAVAAVLSVLGLYLATRRLRRDWPRVDADELPEAAALHERVRCRCRCGLTVLATVVMMRLTLTIGY